MKNRIYDYLKRVYNIEPLPIKSNWEYWEKYLDDPPNPKYFKAALRAKTNKGKKVFFSINLPKKLIFPFIKDKDTVQRLYNEILKRQIKQAQISLTLKENKKQLQTAKTLQILVNNKQVDSLSEFENILRQEEKELEIAIFSQLLPFKNLYEYYTETDYTKTNAFQETGAALAKLLFSITNLNLSSRFLLEEDFLVGVVKKAKINLDNLEKIKLLPNNFFAESGEFLQRIDIESLKEQDFLTIYVDSTPINFLFDKKDFYLVDTESLGLFYKHHTLPHNLVYFLLHFPFQQATGFRRNLIDAWIGRFVKHFTIDEKLLLENLKLQVLAYSTETLFYSYKETQDKSLKKRPNRYRLHKEIVIYNLKLLTQLFPSCKTKSLPKTLKIFY